VRFSHSRQRSQVATRPLRLAGALELRDALAERVPVERVDGRQRRHGGVGLARRMERQVVEPGEAVVGRSVEREGIGAGTRLRRLRVTARSAGRRALWLGRARRLLGGRHGSFMCDSRLRRHRRVLCDGRFVRHGRSARDRPLRREPGFPRRRLLLRDSRFVPYRHPATHPARREAELFQHRFMQRHLRPP